MDQKLIIRIFLLTVALLAVSLSSASAYETYSANGSSGNCAGCHGDFRTPPYVSLADGADWGNSLHVIHRSNMVSLDCTVCHFPSRSPVFLNTSTGTNGFNIGCNGCHGRAETAAGGQVVGAGLRQHHWTSGVTVCVNCHSDANPGSFTTVGENVPPPYYFTPDTAHPDKPTNPCNPAGEENYAGTSIGLDNDGDGLYDLNDGNCQTNTTAPDINLNPATLNFGSLIIGNSNTLNTQIENLGDAGLVVSNIALGSGTSTEFSFTAAGTPFTIPAGGSQNISVTYQPVDVGTDNGTLVVTSNDPVTPTVSLSINGTGEPSPTPDINLNPATLSFGSVLIGNSSSQNTVIQNLGTAALIVNSIAPAGGTSTEFSFTAQATPFTIPLGGSQTVTVTYQPVDAGTDSGALVISSNDPVTPTVSLTLGGTGDAVPTPDINIVPTTLTYSTVMIGKTLTLTPTIQNLGTAALTINTISLCAGTSTEFSWLLTTPLTLQAKTSTTLPVTYAPLDENTDTGCLTIASDDPDEPTVNVTLQATGVIYKSSILRFLPPILNAADKKQK